MSMIDTRSHVRVVECFNGMVFRGRELVVRLSQNRANQTRRKRTESIENIERSSLEELIKRKTELEIRIEEETKKRVREQAQSEREAEIARKRSELATERDNVERRFGQERERTFRERKNVSRKSQS
jgi:RNA recognition motif-containing protein